MASSPNKIVFRQRAVDPGRKMPIRIFRAKAPSPTKIAASIMPPSGMEKGEDKEYDLTQASLAQKAHYQGVNIENVSIPIPKVSTVDTEIYSSLYPETSKPGRKYVVFKGAVAFFLNEGVYDADSEDEEWLKSHDNIPVEDFEKIIERLEVASKNDIIPPNEAKALLQRFDEQMVDDVYDYWLQKRKNAIRIRKCTSLIPQVLTDIKGDQKAVVNPYICFRRRFDKVQTRKKQKLEAEAYEKMLKLNNTVQKSTTLIEMVKKREKSKLALIALDESIFMKRYEMVDSKNRIFDEISQSVRPKFQVPQVPVKKGRPENGKVLPPLLLRPPSPGERKKKRVNHVTKVSPSPSIFNDSSVVSDAWLKKCAESWNRVGPHTPSPSDRGDDQIEAEKIAQFTVNSSVDGRYQFKRKRGCQYRAPITTEPSFTASDDPDVLPIKFEKLKKKDPEEIFDLLDERLFGPGFKPIHKRSSSEGPKFESRHSSQGQLQSSGMAQGQVTSIPNSHQPSLQSTGSVWQYLRAARGRIGRGGRLIFDLIVDKPQELQNTSSKDYIPG